MTSAADRDQPSDGDTRNTPARPAGDKASPGRERRLPRRAARPGASSPRPDALPPAGGDEPERTAVTAEPAAGAGDGSPDGSSEDDRQDGDHTDAEASLSPAVRPPDSALAPPDRPMLGAAGGRARPPVGPVTILGAAALVLLVLLVIIVLGQDNGSKQETAAPCLQTDLPTALDDINDGRVTAIRAAAAENVPDRFAVAVEIELDGGGCLALPQGAASTEQRSAIIGAATIYNSLTEQRRISIQIDRISLPSTETPVPTQEPTAPPTTAPTIPPTVAPPAPPAIVLPGGRPGGDQPATPGTPLIIATPIL